MKGDTKMSFIRGKKKSLKEMLEDAGYVKLDKATMDPKEGVVIDGVEKGESAENGTFVYVSGLYKGSMVYVAVPTASVDDFKDITAEDLEEIRRDNLKMFVEKRTSKGNPPRDYFVAYIDDKPAE